MIQHLSQISLSDKVELRQVGTTKCLVRLNGEYAVLDCSTMRNGQIILIRVHKVGYQLFWNKTI